MPEEVWIGTPGGAGVLAGFRGPAMRYFFPLVFSLLRARQNELMLK